VLINLNESGACDFHLVNVLKMHDSDLVNVLKLSLLEKMKASMLKYVSCLQMEVRFEHWLEYWIKMLE